MEKLVVVYILVTSHAEAFCPDGCGCDEEKLETTCFKTDLEVMPITLNPNIRSLTLKYNQFKTVDASISFYPSLITLDMSSNKIDTLPDKVFLAQKALEDLNLCDNNIKEVSDGVFIGLQNLKRLNLRKNNIRTITKTFKMLKRLEFLDLSENVISSIGYTAFKNLVNLKVLYLQHNYLDLVPSKAVSEPINLVELDLSGNNIRVISSFALPSLASLVILNLAHNKIMEIDEEGFHGLNNLEDMHLEDNKLDKVPTNALCGLINLKKIVLGQNPLKEIRERALSGNQNLQLLNISHCQQMNEIKAGAFTSNHHLRTVVISDNPDLEHIDSKAFSRDIKVTSLDLRRNRLSSLSEHLLDWSYVKILQLSENLWHCDCDMKWLQETIYNIMNNTATSVRIIKCFSPNHLWDHDIVTADIEDCQSVTESEKLKTEESVPDEISVIFIVTLVIATLIVSIVISSGIICIFVCCRRRSSTRSAACNTSDTSRDTDVSYYQVGHQIYASPVINNKNVQNLSPHYLLRTWDESDILYQDDASQRSMVSEQFSRNPL